MPNIIQSYLDKIDTHKRELVKQYLKDQGLLSRKTPSQENELIVLHFAVITNDVGMLESIHRTETDLLKEAYNTALSTAQACNNKACAKLLQAKLDTLRISQPPPSEENSAQEQTEDNHRLTSKSSASAGQRSYANQTQNPNRSTGVSSSEKGDLCSRLLNYAPTTNASLPPLQTASSLTSTLVPKKPTYSPEAKIPCNASENGAAAGLSYPNQNQNLHSQTNIPSSERGDPFHLFHAYYLSLLRSASCSTPAFVPRESTYTPEAKMFNNAQEQARLPQQTSASSTSVSPSNYPNQVNCGYPHSQTQIPLSSQSLSSAFSLPSMQTNHYVPSSALMFRGSNPLSTTTYPYPANLANSSSSSSAPILHTPLQFQAHPLPQSQTQLFQPPIPTATEPHNMSETIRGKQPSTPSKAVFYHHAKLFFNDSYIKLASLNQDKINNESALACLAILKKKYPRIIEYIDNPHRRPFIASKYKALAAFIKTPNEDSFNDMLYSIEFDIGPCNINLTLETANSEDTCFEQASHSTSCTSESSNPPNHPPEEKPSLSSVVGTHFNKNNKRLPADVNEETQNTDARPPKKTAR